MKYNLDITGAPVEGSTGTAKILVGHNDPTNKVNINSSPELGAGFTYVGNWNMIGFIIK